MTENCDVLLETLVTSYEIIAVKLTKFKIQCFSNDQNKYYADWIDNVSDRLHLLIGRSLIDTFLFKYTYILLPHVCSNPELLLSALSVLNDEQAYKYATMMMCDIKLMAHGYVIQSFDTDNNPVSDIVPLDELNHFAAARFWFILCDDAVLVQQCQFLSAETCRTWVELLTSIVDAIFVPRKRRWGERNITTPEKIKHPIQAGSTAYFTGNGKLLRDNVNAVLLAYAQTCHIVTRLSKTKYTVKLLDKCVNISAEELSHAPPPPLLRGLQTYDQLFFFGGTQTLGKAVLKFGDCGQVVGPAKYKRMKQCGVAMFFPALMCIVDCYITEVRTFAHTHIPRLTKTHQDSRVSSRANAVEPVPTFSQSTA